MSHADQAGEVVGLQAHLVGLWLAAHHQRGISPQVGVSLVELAADCSEELLAETNPVIVSDVSQFIRALTLVANAALVQDAVILDQIARLVGTQEKEV
ncbi:MAG: hypothetical protein U1B30_15810 [Pseudomonadota bacterium]|nr:hypothetical protein [Pseudomonadota bacterium]